MAKVVTYSHAYERASRIELCEFHGRTTTPLGRVEHGAHQGWCDVCTGQVDQRIWEARGRDLPGVYADLLAYETDASRPPDGRRVIRDERLRLVAARDPDDIIARATEARRVLEMWQ